VEQGLFERLAGGEEIHGTIISGGGWSALLQGYAEAVAKEA
jgi:hypothetical protein